jgi:uncharacterized cupredoxin-like copper-binding protein
MNPANILSTLFLALAGTAALAAGEHAGGHEGSAIGQPGVAARVSRTVNIDMRDDMRFHAAKFDVKQGETIRFVAKNSGKLKHEMVLGTAKELRDHNELMKKHPGMEHDEPSMVTVAPGKSGAIIWHFTRAGKVDFACLQPGHYDAGMKGMVNVRSGKAPAKAGTYGTH